jgi:hypothetical protein
MPSDLMYIVPQSLEELWQIMFRKQTLSSQAGTVPLPCKDGYVHHPKELKLEIVTPASNIVMCSVSQCREKGKDSPSIERFRVEPMMCSVS